MINEKVAGADPVVGREQSAKFDFDADGIPGDRPAETLRQAGNVGIDDHRRDLEGGAEDDVGGLAADAGEGGQRRQGGWNFAVVALDQPLGAADEVAGFNMIKTGGTDQCFDLAEICLAEGGSIRVAGKEAGGDEVDAQVSALGGKDGGDEEFKGGAMCQGALGTRIKLCQSVEEGGRGSP